MPPLALRAEPIADKSETVKRQMEAFDEVAPGAWWHDAAGDGSLSLWILRQPDRFEVRLVDVPGPGEPPMDAPPCAQTFGTLDLPLHQALNDVARDAFDFAADLLRARRHASAHAINMLQRRAFKRMPR